MLDTTQMKIIPGTIRSGSNKCVAFVMSFLCGREGVLVSDWGLRVPDKLS